MHRTQALTFIGLALLLVGSTTTYAQDEVENAIKAQVSSLQTSADVQKRINALDDQTRDLLNDYRATLSQVKDLDAYNDQLDQLVATQRVEIADYERQFQEREVPVTSGRRILHLAGRQDFRI